MNKLFSILTLLISLQLPAVAQQATAFKDKNNSLFLYALPPNQPVEIEWQKPLEKAIQANECGLIIIKASADTFSLENQIIMPGFKLEFRLNHEKRPSTAELTRDLPKI